MLCSNCESSELTEFDDGESCGWMCPSATQYPKGNGCHVLVTNAEYAKMKKTSKSTPSLKKEEDDDTDKENTKPKPAPKKRPVKKSTPSAKHTPITNMSMSEILSTQSSNGKMSLAAKLKAKREHEHNSFVSQWSDPSIFAEDDESSSSPSQSQSQSQHIQRASIMDVLTIKGDEAVLGDKYLKRPFVQPKKLKTGATKEAAALMQIKQASHGRRLGARCRPYTGIFQPMKKLAEADAEIPTDSVLPPPIVEKAPEKPGYEPLIVYQPTEEEVIEDPTRTPIEVPPIIGQFLRPHQREGVRFMAECVLGQRRFKGNGAILADDMGLGKTLQSITLLYTLLTQGFHKDQPVARRVVIVCPTSLVGNWKNEVAKWLKDAITCIALSESSRDNVISGIDTFLSPTCPSRVLIISYDTFRLHAARLQKPGTCDLLICDEAHRLKNAKTGTYQALEQLPCARRILLSGTPMQNDLEEFFAMVHFTNPNVIGDRKSFKKYYEHPILTGREPDASESESALGIERSSELSAIVNQFVLRRTNALLSQHLPPKVIQVVLCRPTPLQIALYQHFCKSKVVRKILADGDSGSSKGGGQVLPLIGNLKKLCNHPKLIYDAAKEEGANFLGFSNCGKFFDTPFLQRALDPSHSGKMRVLMSLLSTVKKTTDDRVVIVSNYTQTLDLIGELCQKVFHWEFLRLDGTTSIKKRQLLVDELSCRTNKIFLFLLSSKAGGCGLNLVGANRLVLFDPDWNPAVDKQAAARVWRDGQTKRCFIYRFLTTGTIEEKVYQRQMSKEGLQNVIGGAASESAVSSEDLRDLFTLRSHTASDTHDQLSCRCCCEEKDDPPAQAEDEDKDWTDSKDNAIDEPPIIPISSLSTLSATPASHDIPASTTSKRKSKKGKKKKKSHDSDDDDEMDEDGDEETTSTDEILTDPNSPYVQQQLQQHPHRAMLGQRGFPEEQELINFAHHMTVQSVPDPIFRKAHTEMMTQGVENGGVSFVFSCEIAGRPLSAAQEAEAAAVSARCDLEPEVTLVENVPTITAEEAYQRHDEYEKGKRRKRKGGDDSDDDLDMMDQPASARRSSRVRQPTQRLVDETGEDTTTTSPTTTKKGRKRKTDENIMIDTHVLDDMDDATRALVMSMTQEEETNTGKRTRGKAIAATTPTPSPQPESEPAAVADEEVFSEHEEGEVMIDIPASNVSPAVMMPSVPVLPIMMDDDDDVFEDTPQRPLPTLVPPPSKKNKTRTSPRKSKKQVIAIDDDDFE